MIWDQDTLDGNGVKVWLGEDEGYSAGVSSPAEPKPQPKEGGETKFSRATSEPTGMVSERDLQAVVDTAQLKFKNLPPVVILQVPENAPEWLRDKIGAAALSSKIEAVYANGTIYMFRYRIASMERAEHIMLEHELRHYGLRGTLGPNLDPALRNLYLNNLQLRATADEIKSKYNLESVTEAIEEAVVDMKINDLQKLTGWRKFVIAVRNALRTIGLEKLADRLDKYLAGKFSQSDAATQSLVDILTAADEWVKTGKAPPSEWMGGIRFSRAGDITDRIEQAREQGYKATATAIVNRIDQALNPLGTLPEQEKYLAQRGLAQGLIEKADEIAPVIRNVFQKATPEDTKAIYDYLTTANAKPDGIKDAAVRATAVEVKAKINATGENLIAHGMLREEEHAKYKDAYLPRLYLKHLLNESDWKALGAGKKVSDMGYLKKRKEISPEVRKVILGEVTDPGFLAAVAIAKPARDMALLDWLGQISKEKKWILPGTLVSYTSPLTNRTIQSTPFWLKEEATQLRKQARYYTDENATKAEAEARAMDHIADDALEGIQGEHRDFKQIPNNARYGMLRGMFVRTEIYNDLMGINDFLPTDPGWFQNVFGYGGVGTKATQIWKGMKVAMNPPAQIRNFVSNGVLMQLGGVPLRLVPTRIIQAIGEIRSNGQHYQVAKEYGVGLSTFATQEVFRMKTELLDLEMKTSGMGVWGRVHRLAALVMNKASDFYQMSETIFKTAMIIDGMERQGMTKEQAVAYGQKWLFDYSLIQKSARYARSAPIGIPFLTFQLKVLPRLIEVAALHPQRLIPWVSLFYGMPMLTAMMLGVDKDDLDKLKKAMPQWLQDKGHALILPYKDDNGRWQVVDLGYFMPWTNWTQLAGNIAAGEAGKAAQTAMIFSGPITDIIVAVKTGKDPFTGRDILNKGDTPGRQVVSLINYVWNMGAPPFLTDHGLLSPMGILDQAYGGKAVQAITGTTNKFGEPRSTAEQAMLYLGGVNLYGLTPEYSRATNLQQMKRDLQDVKTTMVQKLQDRSLSAEQRRAIAQDYADEVMQRAAKMQKYVRESAIAPSLATH